jgi:hypothetical protein
VSCKVLVLREFLEELPDNANVWIDDYDGLLIVDTDEFTSFDIGNEDMVDAPLTPEDDED